MKHPTLKALCIALAIATACTPTTLYLVAPGGAATASSSGEECPAENLTDFLAGAPTGFNGSAGTGSICVRLAGAGPVDCAPGQIPDYARLPGAWGPNAWPAAPILAMSLGIDLMPVFPTQIKVGDFLDGVEIVSEDDRKTLAVLRMEAAHGWVALFFSMEAEDPTEGGCFAPAMEAAKDRGELTSTVFQYAIPGSTQGGADHVYTALYREELNLGLGEALQGLNVHMAFQHSGLTGTPADDFFSAPLPTPENTVLYFTLHPEVVDSQPFSDWAAQFPKKTAIWKVAWNAGASRWDNPVPFASYEQLSIDESDVVDGLAVYGQMVMFSTRDAEEIEQFQFIDLGAATPTRLPVAFVEPIVEPSEPRKYWHGGRRLQTKKRAGDFCLLDPFHKHWGAKVPDDFLVARPVDPAGAFSNRIAVSAFRQTVEGSTVMRAIIRLRGWTDQFKSVKVQVQPIAGYAPGAPGVAVNDAAWTALDVLPSNATVFQRDIPVPGGPPAFAQNRALVVRWLVRVEGTWHYSRYSVLRY